MLLYAAADIDRQSLCLLSLFPPLSLPDCVSVTLPFLHVSVSPHSSFFLFCRVSPSCSLAGYNNLEVAEYLLEHGADVNAQDKGGLIPLHNAASYGVRQAHACYNITECEL